MNENDPFLGIDLFKKYPMDEKLKSIDIDNEYILIQKKKSKQPRMIRDAILRIKGKAK